jgi:glycosyltransferase involved in cell wall biosynthesis
MMFHIKNFIRAIIGFVTAILPSGERKNKLYINLRAMNTLGGPERFLRNFSGVLQEKDVSISNWTLTECNAALVFSASWGDSFSWLCRWLGVRSALRVDGFYVPELYGNNKKYSLTRYQQWVNHRLKADLELFDHVIYQSHFSKEQADTHLYHRQDAYSIIHNGVDTEFFTPRTEKRKTGPPTIMVLGKHYPEHLALALDVFERVRSMKNVRLLIVGPMRDRAQPVSTFLTEHFKDIPFRDDIECLGVVPFEKLPHILTKADIFLHVKVGDWCPNAVLEAMACGLPVACPAWGGTKEIVGPAGIAVKGSKGNSPWNVDEVLCDGMTNAIFQILEELKDYRHLALKRAQQYDIRIMAAKYLKCMGIISRAN